MKKINGVALTEKGVLKNAVRAGIVSKVSAIVNENLGEDFDQYEERKAWAMPYEDSNGNIVYATLTLTVGTKAPNEKAVRKSTHKAQVQEEVISIED